MREWENAGETSVGNCVLLCRLVHHSEWGIRVDSGRPEFLPPGWIDIDRRPRQRPMIHLLDIAAWDLPDLDREGSVPVAAGR